MSHLIKFVLFALLFFALAGHVTGLERVARQSEDNVVDDSSLGNVFSNFISTLSNLFSTGNVTTGNATNETGPTNLAVVQAQSSSTTQSTTTSLRQTTTTTTPGNLKM